MSDAAALYYLGGWSKRWRYATIVVVTLGLVSIIFISVSKLSHVCPMQSLLWLTLTYPWLQLESLARLAPAVFATLVELSVTAGQIHCVWKFEGSFKHRLCLAVFSAGRDL